MTAPPTDASRGSPDAVDLPASVDLIVDGRAVGGAAARPLLGLTLADRALLAGRRAGFAGLRLIAGPEAAAQAAPRSAAADRADVAATPPTGPLARPAVWVAPDVVAETGWLRALAGAPPAAGEVRRIAPGVAAAGVGVDPAQLAEAAMAADGEAAAAEDARILRLASNADRAAAEKRLMAALVKDTDGVMARYVARPVSLRLSRRLAPTGVTPNQMTFVCMLIGLAAAPFFLSASPWLQAAGGLLFVIHSIVDGCDGELARLKFTESRFGGLFDFWSDNLVHVAVFGCMGVGWVLAEDALWPLWFMAGALVGTAGSALAVHMLTLRPARPAAEKTAADAKAAGAPVYTSVAAGPKDRLTRALDELSRRDFIYLVFALSLFGKAAWFLAAAGVGAPVFLAFVLFLAWRNRRPLAKAS